MIRELAAGGMTMLIATHEMGFARDIADRVLLPRRRAGSSSRARRSRSSPSRREQRTQQFLQRIIEAGRM